MLDHARHEEIQFGEQIEICIENAFAAVTMLLDGGTTGKLILRIV